ncbi:hypothetical protein [Georgenia daeguensis]|uniref:Ferritin-like domain-containing protein n=1 Tax=Georgenia daeguensis TaxID=908355 RepID=A0ABP6UKQ1_9MICO
MTAAAFDVRAYMRSPRDLRPEDVDLTATRPLRPAALRALVHLAHVERSALTRMRDLLVTPTHADVRVTAFLTTWSYEQHWLAETLDAVIAANGRTAAAPRPTPGGRVLRAWDERCRPTVEAVRSNLLGADVVGGHMVTGWLDTAVVTLVYRHLAAAEPRLRELSSAAERVKERHEAFCAHEATARLSAGAGARRLARRAVAGWSWPGTRYAGAPGAAVLVPLLATASGRRALEHLDEGVAAFPGLAGVRPVRAAVRSLKVAPIR